MEKKFNGRSENVVVNVEYIFRLAHANVLLISNKSGNKSSVVLFVKGLYSNHCKQRNERYYTRERRKNGDATAEEKR